MSKNKKILSEFLDYLQEQEPNELVYRLDKGLVDEFVETDSNEYGPTRDFQEFEDMANDFAEKEGFQYKRFIVFAWDDHEAAGGMNDYQFCSDNVNDAFDWIKSRRLKKNTIDKFDEFQVFDRELGKETVLDNI